MDGKYCFYEYNEDGAPVKMGELSIIENTITILDDQHGTLANLFPEGPITQKTLDVMKSLKRNHYGYLVKEDDVTKN